MSNLQSKTIVFISEVQGITVEETAVISKIEGNKVYCRDEYGYDHVFNSETGYCYTDNLTFGSKKYLKLQ